MSDEGDWTLEGAARLVLRIVSSWRCEFLTRSELVQDFRRIDGGRTSRWEITGQQSDADEQDGDRNKGCEIKARGAVENARHGPIERRREDEADDDAADGKKQALAHDHLEDPVLLRSQGDADTNLLAALRDGVGEDSVDTDDGEHESDDGECAD